MFSFFLNLTGGIFDFNTEKTEKIFRHACSFANENILKDYNYALMPDIHLIDPGNERQVSIELCECLNVCCIRIERSR